MKKAMEQVRRSSRRNKKEDGGGGPSAPSASAAASSSSTPTSSSTSTTKQGSPEKSSSSKQQQHHLGMSPDEAALTAKNYRLAKELSELRVRHREECKTVTKLTMENMNLATRCRDAIGQVAMLKRELAILRRASSAAGHPQATAPTITIAPPPDSPLTPARKRSSSSTASSPTTSNSRPPTPSNSKKAAAVNNTDIEMERVGRVLAKARQLGADDDEEGENDGIASKDLQISPIRPSSSAEEKKENDVDAAHNQETPQLVSSDDYEEEEDENNSNDDTAANDDSHPDDGHEELEPPALTTPPQSKRVRELVAAVQEGVNTSSSSLLREQKTSSPVDLDDSNVIHDDDDSSTSGEGDEKDDVMPSPIKSISEKTQHSHGSSSAESNKSTGSGGSGGPGGLFPKTASPRPSYNEEFPGDITAAAVRQQHHHLHHSRLGRFQESLSEPAEDTAAGALPSLSLTSLQSKLSKKQEGLPPEQRPEQSQKRLAPFDRLRQNTGTSVISSIDAFEASFNTNFPESFSPREDDLVESDGKKGSGDNEPYNPFSPSPQRPLRRSPPAGPPSDERLHYEQQQQQQQQQQPKSKQDQLQPSPSSNQYNRIGAVVESSYHRRTTSSSPRTTPHHLSGRSSSGSSSGHTRSSPSCDPPGRDKTSTRRNNTNINNSPASSASSVTSASSAGNNTAAAIMSTPSPKVSRASPLLSGGKSQVALSVARMRQQLFTLGRSSPSQKTENISNSSSPNNNNNNNSKTTSYTSSNSMFRTASPVMSTPPQKRETAILAETDSYRTPSPLATSNPKTALLSEPSRPEKSGYESSRARYEKATKSTSARLSDRVAAISAAVRGDGPGSSSINKESWGSSQSDDDPLLEVSSSNNSSNGLHIRTQLAVPPSASTTTAATTGMSESEDRLSPSSLGARASGVKAKIATLEAASPGSNSSRGADSATTPRLVIDRSSIQQHSLYAPGEDMEGDIPMRTNISRFESNNSRSPVPAAKTSLAPPSSSASYRDRSRQWESSPSSARASYGSARGIDSSDDDRLRPPGTGGYGRSHHENYENAISGSLPRTNRLVHNEGTSGRDGPSWR